MASLGEKLKGVNWKSVLIDHCEKIVLGGVGLFVLASLGLTQWSTYQTKPEAFTQKTNTGLNTFKNAKWPQERKGEFDARDLGDVVARVTEGIPSSQGDIYSWTAKWSPGVYKEKELVDEPKYERLLEPVATAGRILIALLPDTNAAPMTPGVIAGANAPAPGTSLVADDEFAPKPGQFQANPMPVGGSMPPAAAPGGAHGAAAAPASRPASKPARGAGATPGGGHGAGGSAPGMEMMMSGAGGGADMGVKVNAKGYRFVAVRAYFPMKTQLELMRKAMKLENANQAFEHVRFWDFKLQRQTAVAGPNPWPAAWEDLDIDTAKDILSRAEFDQDVVDEKYREAVFTMPLPLRVYGIWGSMVSHPQIKKLLTDEEATRQEAAAQAAIEASKELKDSKSSGRGGFGGVQHDTKSMMRQIQGNSSAMQTYNQSISGSMMGMESSMGARGNSSAPGMMNPGMSSGMMSSGGMVGGMGQGATVAMSDLLLFRYLDFDVIPGNAYRYRIQLEFGNPNFQRDATELKDPSSANGESRISAWSDPTNPTVIDDELRVFVTRVEKKSVERETTANLDAFQYLTDSGTYVTAPLKSLGRGEPIATKPKGIAPKTAKSEETVTGGVKVEIARPAQQTFMEEFIDFETPNILVDIAASTFIDTNEHPDLELTQKKITLVRREEAVMVNRFGEIVEVDSVTQKSVQDDVQGTMAKQTALFGNLKGIAPAGGMSGSAGGLEGYLTAGGAEKTMPGMAPASAPGGTKKRPSALKKQPGMGMSSMGMGMEGGMSGMPAAPAGAGPRGRSAK